MKNAVKFVFLALLASLFVVSAVSASIDIVNPSPASFSNAQHNSDLQVSFQITASMGENYSSFSFTDNAPSSKGTWTFPSGAFALNEGQTSATLTATYHVNQFTSPGAISPTPSFSANTQNASGAARTDSQSIPITVAVSSSISFVEVTKTTPTTNGQLKITNNGNQQVSGTLTPSTSGNAQISVSPTTYNVAPGASQTFTVTATDTTNLKLGNNFVAVTASNPATTINANVYGSFCSNGPQGTNLSVTDVTINSDGDDDNTWKPLDTIKVDVDFENPSSEKVRNVVIELALYDSAGNKKTKSFDFINSDNEKIKYGSLNDGDDDTVTFEFQVPADIKDGDYKLVAKAYSTDVGESNLCSDRTPEDVSVEKESDNGKYISFSNILVSPTEATCGDSVTLSFTAYNVGDEDQDKVKVMASSSSFNFSQYNEISSMDQGDKQELTYSFIVPAGLPDKVYNVQLDADYDYNKGTYRQGLDHATDVPIKIFGCTAVASKIASVSAELSSSEAVAGSPVDIRVTITNPTLSTATYTLGASGYSSWADSADISSKTITLGAGQSKDVTYSFQTKSDASGEQTFSVDLDSNGKSDSREVSVDIQSGSSISSLFAGKSTIFWIIVAANVVLVILIIIVAVKLASR